jgi:hypothetical protein
MKNVKINNLQTIQNVGYIKSTVVFYIHNLKINQIIVQDHHLKKIRRNVHVKQKMEKDNV